MIRLTAGNDTPFIWAVKLQGQPFDLSGKDVKVYVINSRGEIPVASINIEGNRVSGVFEGRYQTRLGMHSLALRVNEGRPEMKTATVANAFELVQWSADAGGSEAGDVIFAPVVIISELRIGTGGGGEGGGSYDDTAIWEALNDKVDKEKGKGLSSNDFTNALKEKLEGLKNYDDAEISSAVEKLSRDFNALLGDNASAAIESFNEIIAFLEGIEDSESLDAIVASIQQEIAKVSTNTNAKLTELSAEVSGLSERIDNLPSGESSVFEAVYGTTTYEEIVEAYKAGKHCLCVKDDLIYNIVTFNEGGDLLFTCIRQVYAYTVTCTASGLWHSSLYTIEKTGNKTNAISAESTDTQYPSAKAVYDFVNNTLGTIINGDY